MHMTVAMKAAPVLTVKFVLESVRKMTEYWVVRIEWSQTDREHVLVEAETAQQAEQRIRDNGCNARYITASYKAKVLD
jgi:hypothetical protein